jgi:hypothetical protein
MELIKKGFHKDCVFIAFNYLGIKKLTLADIRENLKELHPAENLDITHKFLTLHVSGHAATAIVEIYLNRRPLSTHHVSLYKLKAGWKIVGKIVDIAGYTPPRERKAIKVDPQIYDAYVGEYAWGDRGFIKVIKENNRLFVRTPSSVRGAVELFPETETRFFTKVVETTVDFVKDNQGKVNELIILYNGQKTAARRIKPRVAVFTGQRQELKISAVVDGPFPEKTEALKKYGGNLPKGLIILNASPKGYAKGCFVVKQAAVISTRDLERVWRARLARGELGIGFRLKPGAAGRLAKYTAANKGKKVAIILGHRVMTAPTIQDVISNEGIISGRFTGEELDQIIIQLKLAISKSR